VIRDFLYARADALLTWKLNPLVPRSKVRARDADGEINQLGGLVDQIFG
jgi:hypothetical protein